MHIPLSLAAVCALLLGNPSEAASLPRTSTLHPTISWGNCTENDPPRLECGRMTVPLDYSKPAGKLITLVMSRLRSTSQGPAPLGTLLVNLGGPGAPTAEFIAETGLRGQGLFSDRLMAGYDIVGLDPRGVGLSNPVKCDPVLWNKRINLFPTTTQEYNELLAHNKAVGESCAKQTGHLMSHLDTLNVVEDFEMFRRAIDEKAGLNFLAFSYGTQIALQYAEKYPRNVNRFVLDAVTDHTLPETATLVTAAQTNEATLNEFFRWCNTSSDSVLRGQDGAALFDALVARAAKSPIPAPGCPSTGPTACRPDVSDQDLINVALGRLAGPSIAETWPTLALGLTQAARGNATLLSPPLVTPDTAGGIYSFVAVACQDWLREGVSAVDFVGRARILAAVAPHTKGLSQNYFGLASCAGWPAAVTNPQRVPDAKARMEAPPMLLVNALYDPETSVVWATGVHEQWPKSVLLTRNGAGHTTYLKSQTGETRDAEETFLLTGLLPADGLMLDS